MDNSLVKNLRVTFAVLLSSVVFVGIIWGTNQLIIALYYKSACIDYAQNNSLNFENLNNKPRSFVPQSATFKTLDNSKTKKIPIDEILEQGPGKAMKKVHTPIIVAVIFLDIFLFYFLIFKVLLRSKKNKEVKNSIATHEDFLHSKKDLEEDILIKNQLSELIIERFRESNGIDLKKDANAVARINDFIEKNYSLFKDNSSLTIQMPYIYANTDGTFHLDDTINQSMLKN